MAAIHDPHPDFALPDRPACGSKARSPEIDPARTTCRRCLDMRASRQRRLERADQARAAARPLTPAERRPQEPEVFRIS